MRNIAVIIITYNAEKWLNKCLDSILNSSIALKIYIYDNASTDNTISIINYFENNINCIAGKKNIGFGAANNICIKRAYEDGYKHFFLINQDVYISSNTVEILLNELIKNPEIGIISPLHFNGYGSAFDKNFLNNLSGSNNKEFVNDIFFKNIQPLYFLPGINAACWLLPKNTISKIGGFDPLFFHYAEDDNYCQRVLFHGLKIAVATNTFIYHHRDDRNGDIWNEFKKEAQLRSWLVKIADLNRQAEKIDMLTLQNSFKAAFIKELLKFKFKNAVNEIKQFRKKKKLFEQVMKHRKINKNIGLNWLGNPQEI